MRTFIYALFLMALLPSCTVCEDYLNGMHYLQLEFQNEAGEDIISSLEGKKVLFYMEKEDGGLEVLETKHIEWWHKDQGYIRVDLLVDCRFTPVNFQVEVVDSVLVEGQFFIESLYPKNSSCYQKCGKEGAQGQIVQMEIQGNTHEVIVGQNQVIPVIF